MLLNLKKLRRTLGMNQREFAARIGVHMQTLSRYERDEISPSADLLNVLSKQFNTNLNWLMHGEGPMFNDGPHEGIVEDGHHHYLAGNQSALCRIPLYGTRTSPEAPGQMTDKDSMALLDFSRDWIKHELGLDPADLFAVTVSGDSMQPALREKDLVLCCRVKSAPGVDGIYALSRNGNLELKRLQFIAGAEVKVTSDNKLYEPFTAKLSELTILGRAVWLGRQLQ